MCNALQRAPIGVRPFVLIRHIGKWEGRECVDVLPIGLHESALRDALVTLDTALARHTQLVERAYNPNAPHVNRCAIAPYNFGGHLTAPIGLRVYGAPPLGNGCGAMNPYARQVLAWLQECELCDRWTFDCV